MDRFQLFPLSTRIEATRLTIGGRGISGLVEAHGTPPDVYDKSTPDAAAETYRAHLATHYPAPASPTRAKPRSTPGWRNGPIRMG
jgi:hypothetical protein